MPCRDERSSRTGRRARRPRDAENALHRRIETLHVSAVVQQATRGGVLPHLRNCSFHSQRGKGLVPPDDEAIEEDRGREERDDRAVSDRRPARRDDLSRSEHRQDDDHQAGSLGEKMRRGQDGAKQEQQRRAFEQRPRQAGSQDRDAQRRRAERTP